MYKSIKIDQPIFIIGVGRSGTTLLQSMLNAHSKIIFPPETHFFRNYIANPKVNKNLLNENLKWFKNKLFNDENLLKLDIDLENIFDLLMEQSNFSLINFYKRILMKYSENQNKTIIGDKDPKNIENLKEINKYFPQANILHIIRDPRDVLLSRMKAEWSKDRHYFLHIMAYREQLRFGRNWGPKLFQENYHELFYEELIENPRKELKKITNRLNINYDEKMLYFNKKADEIIKGEETKWKKNCFKPVMKSNKNKWKKNLSKKKIYMVEKFCTISFEKLNYNKSDSRKEVNVFNRIFINLISILFPIIDLSYKGYQYIKSKLNDFYFKRND